MYSVYVPMNICVVCVHTCECVCVLYVPVNVCIQHVCL